MPVVGGGDHHGIDGRILEHFTVVLVYGQIHSSFIPVGFRQVMAFGDTAKPDLGYIYPVAGDIFAQYMRRDDGGGKISSSSEKDGDTYINYRLMSYILHFPDKKYTYVLFIIRLFAQSAYKLIKNISRISSRSLI